MPGGNSVKNGAPGLEKVGAIAPLRRYLESPADDSDRAADNRTASRSSVGGQGYHMEGTMAHSRTD